MSKTETHSGQLIEIYTDLKRKPSFREIIKSLKVLGHKFENINYKHNSFYSDTIIKIKDR